MNALFKSKLFWSALVVAVLIVIAVVKVKSGNGVSADTYAVLKGDIRSEVSLSGKVKPVTEMNLAFSSSGRVAWIGTRVGNKAMAGQALASLDHSTLTAQLDQAKASLAIENATLDSLIDGSRPEDVEIARIKYENTQQTLANKEVLLYDVVSSAYIKSENAIHNYADQFFSNPTTAGAKVIVPVPGNYKLQLESARPILETVLIDWQTKLSIKASPEVEADSARLALSKLREFSSLLAQGINAMTPDASISATTLASYKADVSTLRNILELELGNVTSAIQAWVDARSNSVLLNEQYNLAKAPARVEDVNAQRARVTRAEAEVSRLQSEVYRTSIFAPVSGLIARQDFEVGEIAGPTDAKIRIISDKALSIEVNVAEADIVSVKVGQEVEVTTDAYSSDVVFKATVTQIDPAETIVDGVSTYKARISFVDDDGRLRAGMTANIIIVTESKSAVLVVPGRFIMEKDGKDFVYVLGADGTKTAKNVVTGLRGSDGNIEIVSGVAEGEVLVFSEL